MTHEGDQRTPAAGKGILYGLVGALVGALVVAILVLGGVANPGGDESTPSASTPTSSSEPTSGQAVDPEPTASPSASGQPASPTSTAESTSPAAPTTPPEPRPWSASEAAPDGGTYTGVVRQVGTQQSDTEYPVTMTFTSAGSRVEYPTLGCTGTLRPTGDVDGARVYRETITSGTCDRGGSWHVTRGDANTVTAQYRPAAGEYTVEGQLTR